VLAPPLQVSIYNTPQLEGAGTARQLTSAARRLFPKGALVAVCEPYCKVAADGGTVVRVDNPAEVRARVPVCLCARVPVCPCACVPACLWCCGCLHTWWGTSLCLLDLRDCTAPTHTATHTHTDGHTAPNTHTQCAGGVP
jgi:hypothetical protein